MLHLDHAHARMMTGRVLRFARRIVANCAGTGFCARSGDGPVLKRPARGRRHVSFDTGFDDDLSVSAHKAALNMVDFLVNENLIH